MSTICRFLLSLLAVLFLVAPDVADAKWIDAGPIWNNFDAQQKCPGVCGGANEWDGNWKTTKPGQMSVCSCKGGKHHEAGGSGGSGASCSSPPTKACAGCSVSCPPGQAATCTGGQDTSGGGGLCWTRASCTCR